MDHYRRATTPPCVSVGTMITELSSFCLTLVPQWRESRRPTVGDSRLAAGFARPGALFSVRRTKPTAVCSSTEECRVVCVCVFCSVVWWKTGGMNGMNDVSIPGASERPSPSPSPIDPTAESIEGTVTQHRVSVSMTGYCLLFRPHRIIIIGRAAVNFFGKNLLIIIQTSKSWIFNRGKSTTNKMIFMK